VIVFDTNLLDLRVRRAVRSAHKNTRMGREIALGVDCRSSWQSITAFLRFMTNPPVAGARD